MTRYARRFRRIASSLQPYLLRGESAGTFLTENDLVEDLTGASARFLDYYGDEGLRYALGEYGVLRKIEKLGYERVDLHTTIREGRHTLVLEGLQRSTAIPVRIAELMVRREKLVLTSDDPEVPLGPEPFEVLLIDWLLLRHPYGRFTEDRPRLPGQDAPGLGIGAQVLEMLRNAVIRLHLDGLVTTADHFHNASLYALELAFLDPHAGGRLRALERLLLQKESLTLAQASWAVEWGYVREENDTPFVWRGEPQLWSRNGQLAARLDSAVYQRLLEDAASKTKYSLDRPAFDEHWQREKDALTHRAHVD